MKNQITFYKFSNIILNILLSLTVLQTIGKGQEDKFVFDDTSLPKLTQIEKINDARTPDEYPNQVIKWYYYYEHSNGSPNYISLHFRIRALSENNSWFIKVINPSTRKEVDRLDFETFQNQSIKNACQPPIKDSCGAWTKRIRGKKVEVELHSKTNIDGLKLEIDEYSYQDQPPRVEAIIGKKDERIDLGFGIPRDHKYRQWAKPVVAIFFQFVNSGKFTNCTGVLLTTELLLTNYHCMYDKSQLRTAEVWFDFVSNEEKLIQTLKDIVISSSNLDYSILRLSAPMQNWELAKFDNNSIGQNQKLLLFQHPMELAKKLTDQECRITEVVVPDREADFFHICDAEGGSSGSPIMDLEKGNVIGIHHLERRNSNKKKERNLAIKMDTILKDIRDRCPNLYKEITDGNSSLKIPPIKNSI